MEENTNCSTCVFGQEIQFPGREISYKCINQRCPRFGEFGLNEPFGCSYFKMEPKFKKELEDFYRKMKENNKSEEIKKSKERTIKIEVRYANDREKLITALTNSGIWCTIEEVEDWPSTSHKHFVCFKVNEDNIF